MLHRALLDVLQSDFIPLTPDVEQARDQAVLLKLGGHVAATLVFHTDRAIANLVLANMERLTHHALALVPCLEHCPGLYQTALGRILQAFALIQRLRSASAPDRDGLQQEIEPLIDWIARRAADAPNNFLSLSSLINAEHAWARSDFELAAHTYDKAIQESTSLKRPWHRALITERAALFHLENGLRHTGQTLLAEARHLYADWGARAKVQQLERQYDFLRTSETSRGEKHSETIDFLAILRTSQALSSETHLGSLKAKVTELLGAMTGATLVHLVLHDDANGWHVSAESDTSTTRVPVAEAGARGMLPHSAFRYVERTRQPLVVENAARDDRFARDPYFAGLSRCSLLCVPISVHGALLGVLMLENRLSHSAFAADRLDTLLLITGQLAVSLQNARIYAALEQKVAERTVELEKTHRRLLEMSRQAGMTEVASNVLHNVGNVLNSANVSVTLIAESITRSKLPGLGRLVSLMNEHEQHLPTFFGSDPRGKHVPAYLRELLDTLQNERTETLREIESLNRHIGHIKEIVASQQTLAKRVAVRTAVDVNELIEEALRMTLGVQNQSPVSVIRRFGAMPPVILEQHKVLQILINLISNASHACEESGRLDAQLIVQSSHDGATLKIIITDNGMGISPENLTRIFAHGFTTRRGGHGFGLHSCALAAKEMGGSLSAHSAGLAQGATFTLELPMEQPP
jgi:signal transduction histidine kinase